MKRILDCLRQQLDRDETGDALVLLTVLVIAVLYATGVFK